MNTTEIEIKKKKYRIVNDTQNDGRCFSAAIYYLLFKDVADNDQLNNWIKENIIDPILATEDANCIKFFNWATKWAAMPKHGVNHEKGPANFIIDGNISILQQILERIEQTNIFINKQITRTNNLEEFNKAIGILLNNIDIIKFYKLAQEDYYLARYETNYQYQR